MRSYDPADGDKPPKGPDPGQGDLFGEPPDDPKILRDFKEFHAANPQAYELFKFFTRDALQKGHKHLGALMVIYRIRWETPMESTDPVYKINNNHAAYYGRMFMRDFPEHEGFFRTRKVQGDE